MKFFTKFNVPKKVNSPVGKVSLSDSQFMADCDINNVMKRAVAGDTSLIRNTEGVFADVSDYGDFAKCMHRVITARREFEALPSNIRKKFGNDPSNMLSFLADSANDEEAVKLGLKVMPKADTPVKVEVINPVVSGDGTLTGDGLPSNT